MKKIKDYYFKKAKKENYPARSVYKLEEIQHKYQIIKQGDRVLDLGCVPGSWTLFAAKTAGAQGLVVGVDTLKCKKLHLQGGAKIQLHQMDIFSPEAEQTIKALCGSFNVVLSDLAPKTTGNKFSDHQHSIELSRRALAVADSVLIEGGMFYCKIFQGEDFPLFVNEVRGRFKVVKVVKPKSSRSESREMFVLGQKHVKSRTAGIKESLQGG